MCVCVFSFSINHSRCVCVFFFIFHQPFHQNKECVRVVDSRVLVEEIAATKVWTIEVNDSVSLYQCLMGRCFSVLRSDDYEKMSAECASDKMVDAESDAFTFAVECFYFGTGDVEVRNSLLRNWEEHANAKGVLLRESPTNMSIRSKHPGHFSFGFSNKASPFFRFYVALSVTNLDCAYIQSIPNEQRTQR